MTVCAVVGGQYGSEGKGAVVAAIAHRYETHVRVGAANAGHTFYTHDEQTGAWEKHVMQQLPCAAYAHPRATLCIGPGAVVSLGILKREIDELVAWRERRMMGPPKILIDPRAHLITHSQIRREAESGLAERIGSTSATAREGIGIATADRVMRSDSCVPVGELGYRDMGLMTEGLYLTGVPRYLHEHRDGGILLEGTQGTGLSLTTGHFPFVTSRNTTAAGLCADSGVAPTALDRVILVVRTYPIRVAGNSGPFGAGSREIRWEDIGVDPESERTTVTRKVRRVATFDLEEVRRAAYLNGATEIALMFVDYVGEHMAHQMSRSLQTTCGVPVTMWGTGPQTIVHMDNGYGGSE